MPFLETLLGGAVLNVGCGIITNVMDPARKAAWHRVTGWWAQGKTPANHDALRATHNAYVAAMRVMARAATEIAVSNEEVAVARALATLCGESRFYDFRWDGEHLPLDETRDKIDALLDQQRLAGEAAAWRAYNQLVLDDLSIWGINRYPLFDKLFLDGIGHHVPWHLCFREQFNEILKADETRPEGERAFRILTLEALAELKAMGAVVVDGLTRVEGKIDAGNAVGIDTNAMVRMLFDQSRSTNQARSVTDEALIALARRIADKVGDPAAALEELGRAIDEFLRQRMAAGQGSNLGDLVDGTMRRIAAANERGELDKGAAAAARGFADWQDQQASARQAGLRLIDANIEQHRLRFDAVAMAEWIGQRLALANGGSVDVDVLRAEQDEWYQRGLLRGLRLDLDVSIALARRSIDIAQSDTDRAIVQNDLGIALRKQGERTGGETGLALLGAAVDAYRAALTVFTQAAMPADWAMTQNNLGVALRTQGSRTGGEAGLALLGESVGAYRAALTVRTEAAMPVQWAMTQENLAFAYLAIADWRDDPIPDLREAETAVQAALRVYTPEHMGYDHETASRLLGDIRVIIAGHGG